jgi:hypothetical protein
MLGSGMYRKQLRQLRHSVGRLTVYLLFKPARPVRHSESARGTVHLYFAEYSKAISAVLDQAPHLARPKRSAATEHENRFQEAGLAGPIGAKDVVVARREIELDLAQTP